MTRSFITALAALAFATTAVAQTSSVGVANGDKLAKPVRLLADGKPVKVQSPGYACPCWYDVDGDGKKDLIVGQFRGGQMMVYKNLGDGKLAAGTWLQAEGAPAKVPGVW